MTDDRTEKMISKLMKSREELLNQSKKLGIGGIDGTFIATTAFTQYMIDPSSCSADNVYKKFYGFQNEIKWLESTIEDLETGRTTPAEVILERLSRDV